MSQGLISFCLKNDGILVLPTVADPPLKLKSRKGLYAEVHDRAFALLGIASMSGCCQVIPCCSIQSSSILSHPHTLVFFPYFSAFTVHNLFLVLNVRLPFLLENMRTILSPCHLLHLTGLISFYLTLSWICTHLSKMK